MNPTEAQEYRQYSIDGVYPALRASDGGRYAGVCYSLQGNLVDRKTQMNGCGWCANVTHSLNTQDRHAIALCIGNGQLHQMSMQPVCNTLDTMHDKQAVLVDGKAERKYIVRRLTPVECLRLQGLPDWWCDGAGGSDTAIYRMTGNGIALPCAVDVLGRIARELQKDCGRTAEGLRENCRRIAGELSESENAERAE